MSYVKVYHNPYFLEYRGDHSDIVPAARPVASVVVRATMTSAEMLAIGYARTQHGVAYASWFHDPAVMTHLRSTAVGDVLLLPDGTQHVVEAMGFQPFQPRAADAMHRLAEAQQRLEEAVDNGSREVLLAAARASLMAMAQMLAGLHQKETPRPSKPDAAPSVNRRDR